MIAGVAGVEFGHFKGVGDPSEEEGAILEAGNYKSGAGLEAVIPWVG